MLNIVYTGTTNRQTPKLPRDKIKSHLLPDLQCHARATATITNRYLHPLI